MLVVNTYPVPKCFLANFETKYCTEMENIYSYTINRAETNLLQFLKKYVKRRLLYNTLHYRIRTIIRKK